jgi:hypothetical protein
MSLQESGGRLFNCTAEPLGKENPLQVIWRRRPGLSSHANLALTGYRGGILVNNLAYIAAGGKIVTVDSTGTVTVAGNLPGADRVTFARNNVSPNPDIQCVSPANGAFAVTSGSVTAFNAGGVLPAPNWVASQDGYFFWGIGDNRVFAAGPNSTVLNALTFTTVQSRPTGNLLRGVPYQGLMWFFASEFIEVWNDTANPFPGFPYSRYAVIDKGLFGRNAIAGWEDGFGQLLFVGNDAGVYQLAGTAYNKVSPPDLDRLIAAIPSANADTLIAFVYTEGGKSFWVLQSPTWCWEFNLNTQKWEERSSLQAGQFVPWRATGSLNAFGKWLVGDTLSQTLGFIDPTTQQEYGSPVQIRMESAPVVDFPNRANIARSDWNFITGVGLSAGTTQTAQAPQVSISICRDGERWESPRLRQLGAEANGRRRVYATRWGQSTNHGVRWRLELSDEVYAAFLGSTMSDDPRAN